MRDSEASHRDINKYVNLRFGYLVILKEIRKQKLSENGKKITERNFLVRCDCGNTKLIDPRNIIGKGYKVRSCGCKRYEHVKSGRSQDEIIKSNGHSRVYSYYKHSAKQRKIKFELTKEEFSSFLSQNCYFCNKEPTSEHVIKYKNKEPFIFLYTGIDRRNNDEGYTKENCVSCCKYCNGAKSNLTEDEFFTLISNIYLNRVQGY